MTEEEKTNNNLRKEAIKKKLSELQRKIALCVEMLSKAKACQTLLKTEYEKLDRKLFEEDIGITVVKTQKKKAKKTAIEIFTNYDKMSPIDQEKALARLLEIQTNMTQKT